MKIWTIGLDANWRSVQGLIDIPLTKLSETEAVSPKVTSSTFVYVTEPRMNNRPLPRTHQDYAEPFEMHSRDLAHMVITLTGFGESTLQDGTTVRWSPGDMHFTRTMALHHSNNNNANISMSIMVIFWGGTEIDLMDLEFK